MIVIQPTDIARSEGEIVETVRRQAADYRAKKRFITWAMVLVGVGLVATFAFDRMGITPTGWSNVVEFMPWFLVFVGGAAMMARQQLQDSAKRAASLSDKRLLPPVLELLDSEEKSERLLAYEAVKKLLPLFTSADFSDLSRDRVQKLMRAIRHSKDPDFVTVVLSAAKNHGGRDCITPLEAFIKGNSAVRKTERPWSGSLAHMALADIRMRLAKSQIDRAEVEGIDNGVDRIDRMRTSE